MRAAIVLGLLALPVAASADEIYLRGGGRLIGVVVERRAESVVVEVGPGLVTVPASHVERIVEGTPAFVIYRDRSSRLSPTDVNGWLQLALWARDHDLLTQSHQAFDHVLAIDPGNPIAHRDLGHVLFDGRWMSAEEGYRARGYVYFEGSWVTPQEQAAMLSERAAEAQAHQAEMEAAARAREAEARARVAEAEARRAEAEAYSPTGGIPLGMAYGYGGMAYGYGGTPYGYSPVIAGAYIGPYPDFVRPFRNGRPFDGVRRGPGYAPGPRCGLGMTPAGPPWHEPGPSPTVARSRGSVTPLVLNH